MVALMLVVALSTSQVEDAPVQRSLESMSRAELKDEYARVEAARPGLGLPITLMAVGGGSILYGAILLLSFGTSGPGSAFSSNSPVGYVFVALMMAGAGMLFPGLWVLWSRRPERAELGQRMDDISERLDQLDRADEYSKDRREKVRPPSADGYPQL
jgi:hypothetical protein